MRYEARVTAYDVMDAVHISIALYGTPDTPGAPSQLALQRTTTMRGTGEADPHEWLHDALCAAMEAT